MSDAEQPMPPIPRRVRDRDRTGRRCFATHPSRQVKAEGILQPVTCRLVFDHGPDPEVEGGGHFSLDGRVISEW